MPWVTHFDPDPPAHAPFVRGLFGGIVICAMLASVGWLAFRHYGMSLPWRTSGTATQSDRPLSPAASAPSADLPSPDSPNSLSTGGSSLPSQEAQAVPSQAAQSPQPAQSPQEVPSSVAPNAQVPAEETPSTDSAKAAPSPSTQSQLAAPRIAHRETLSARGNSPAPPAQPVARTPVVPPAQPADAGETQLLLAREYLDGAGHARDTTVASRLLWTAVEKGNATAETTLADLYLRGDGVTKNCDQARVLLAAASGKGNVEAMQKLQQLNQTGCR
jgi:TPR repeat protein